MHTLFKSATKLVLVSGLALLLFNCNKDEANPITEAQKVTSTELKTVLETDDLSNATDKVVTDLFQNGESGKSSKQEDCYVSEFSDTGFTVTFDDCSVEGSDKIVGSLTVVYTVGAESTSFTTTYTNLSVGDYTINGTRSFEMNGTGQSSSFTVVSDLTITGIDDVIIEEVGTKTIGFVIDTEIIENSAINIDGNWTVKSNGNTYTISVTNSLELRFGCEYLSKGVMQLNKNGINATVDFGNGTCNDIATLIYPDGTEEEVSLKD